MAMSEDDEGEHQYKTSPFLNKAWRVIGQKSTVAAIEKMFVT
jgi:hypothetical protein